VQTSSPFLASTHERGLAERYVMATIDAYLHWIKSYIRYHCLCHPARMAEKELQPFLTFLASERHVAAKTRAQALNAQVFLCKTILQRPLSLDMQFQHSFKSPKLPAVLTQSEVLAFLLAVPGL